MTSLYKNYILSLITQTITVFCPLIVTPFVSRRLMADNIGIFSFTESVVFIFGFFALFGSHIHGQREIAYCQGDKHKQLQTFAEIFAASGITSLIVLAGYIVFVLFQTRYQLIYWIQVLELVAFYWDIGWFYQGKEDFKSLLYRNLPVKMLYIVLIFSFIRTPDDLPLYVFFRISTYLSGGAALLAPVLYQCRKEKIRVTFSALPCHLRKMLPLFIPQVAIQVYTVLDKTMIGVITRSPYQNGCYEEAMKVIRVLMNFAGVAAGVLLPRIASLHAAGNTDEIRRKISAGIRLVCLITLPMSFGIIMFAPIFVPWFLGPGFDDTVPILQILGILFLVIGIGRITGNCLLAVKKENQYTRNVCIGAGLNFLLNLYLISRYRALGAAIGSVAAEVLVTSLMVCECRHYLSAGRIIKMFFLYLLCAAVMIGSLIIISDRLTVSTFWKLSILSLSGVVIYGTTLLILRDDLILNMIKFIFRKPGARLQGKH